MERRSVPFKTTDTYEGLAETKGLLRFENNQIILQFQTQDAVFGLMKSDVKDVQIPLEALESVEFITRWWGSKIAIHVNRLDLVQRIPGQSSNEIILKITRANKGLAGDISRKIRLSLSEYEYDEALKAS